MSGILIHPFLTLSLPKGVVYSLAVSPDGRMIAGSSGVLWSFFLGKENVIRLWDSYTGEWLHTLIGHTNFVSSITFNLDGSLLMSGSLDGTIKLWNTQTFQEQVTFDQSSPTPWKFDGKPLRMSLPKIDSIALHPNQHWIAAGDISENVTLWDCNSGEKIGLVGGHRAFTSIAFSPDGSLLATCDEHAGYNLFEVPSGNRTYPPTGKLIFGRLNGTNFATFAPTLKAITFSLDGKKLVGGCLKGSIRLWDLGTGKELYKIKAHKTGITALMFGSSGKHLISADFDRKIKLWDAQTTQQLCTFEGHSKQVLAIALSPNGETLVSSGVDRTIRLWRSEFLSA
ncbi:MAG TPA: WD40 repeat domain-containing protein [Coleofasciculaceae cyanobacterium]|jgi:WD40 repeat protein